MTLSSAPGPRPGGPNGWLVLGGVLTAVVLTAGGLSVASWFGYRTETQDHVYRPAGTSISIDIDTGDLTLAPTEADAIAVRRRLFWSFAKPTFDERWDGQTLRVSGECGSWSWIGHGCGVDYTLEVPPGVTVQGHTSTGDISVHNIDGDLQLTTSTGDISVTGAAGTLSLRSSTGDITASALSSSNVEASADTGEVRLTFTAPPRELTVTTSTGDVQVVVPDAAYSVQTHAATGDVRVNVRQDDNAERSIQARTGTGDIEVSYG